MATGYSKSAFESVVGTEFNTPALSTKILYTPLLSFELDPGAAHLERDDELRGVDEPLMVLTEKFAPTWSLSTRAYPDALGYRLKHILGAPTTTVGNGVITDPDAATIPTGAFKHVWSAPFGPAGDSPLTTEEIVAYKDQSSFFKAKGCAAESLSLESPESGGVQLQCSGPAAYVVRIADPSLTPTYESLATRPFMLPDLTIVTWLAGTATSTEFSVGVANSVEEIRDLGVPTLYRAALAKGDLPIISSGSISKRSIDPEDWDALIGATGFAVKSRWTSRSIIASGYPFKLYYEADNAQYVGGGPAALANQRRIGATFDWKATYDGAGASSTWTLVNNVSSYV